MILDSLVLRNHCILYMYFQGDSGGPLVCEDGKAYGVVSSAFSPHGGGPKMYNYAKIPDYRYWIDSFMKYNGKL